MGSKITGGLMKAFLDWLMNLLIEIGRFYQARDENQRRNQQATERLEEAETDEERQRATDELAGNLGRRRPR